MADTFTTNLRFQQPQVGADTNTWGGILNTDWTLVDSAIAGRTVKDLTGLTAYTLTSNNGIADQARQPLYEFIGTLSADCTVTIPAVVKAVAWVTNFTTGSHSVILTTGSGTTVTVGNDGGWVPFFCDGVNVVSIPVTVPTLTAPFLNFGSGAGSFLTIGTETVTTAVDMSPITVGMNFVSAALQLNVSWENVYIQGFYNPGTNAGIIFNVGTATPQAFTMDDAGNANAPGSWINGSDARVKDRLETIDDPLVRLMQVTGYTYLRSDIPGAGRRAGLLAQDLERALPEAVHESAKPPAGFEGRGFLSVDPAATNALLIEVCKALLGRIETLERR